jgi:broad specificity phosphatase PhoE
VTRRLLLVRHASTDAVRAAAFGADEPLDVSGRVAAAELAARLPRADEVLVSPALRARETASSAGLPAAGEAPGECDFGTWAGRTLREVAASDEAGVRAWMTDPDAAPHGGEALSALLARVRSWLAFQASPGCGGTAIAITHAGVVKAAVLCALDAPPRAFWRIDVAPLSITELHAHDGRWTVTRVNDRGDVR